MDDLGTDIRLQRFVIVENPIVSPITAPPSANAHHGYGNLVRVGTTDAQHIISMMTSQRTCRESMTSRRQFCSNQEET
jgi:hypothetical protein